MREGEPMAENEPITRGALRFWNARGVVLPAGDRNEISVDDLKEFAEYVSLRMPGAVVQVHAFGLRATQYEGTDGPRLDWRDWD